MFFLKDLIVIMIRFLIKITITYCQLKSKIRLNKVPVMTNNTLDNQ